MIDDGTLTIQAPLQVTNTDEQRDHNNGNTTELPETLPPAVEPLPTPTWDECPDSTAAHVWSGALAAPRFALDFESLGELAARGGKFTDNQIALDAGRDGLAARVISGAVSVPFRDAVNLDRGTLGLWIGTGDWYPQLPQQIVLLGTENPLVKGAATGADLFLRLTTPAPTAATPTPAAQLLFSAGGANAAQNGNIVIPVNTWGPGEWHHVAISWEHAGTGQAFTLFVDGLPTGAMTAAVPFDTATAPQFLYLASTGRTGWKTTHPGTVQLDQLRSYDTPLGANVLRAWVMASIDNGATVRSDRLQLLVARALDGFGLLGLDDLKQQRTLTTQLPSRLLWQLALQTDGKPTTPIYRLTNLAAGLAQLQCRQQSDGRALELTWHHVPLPATGATDAPRATVDVVTTFMAGTDGIDGKIRVDAAHAGPWQVRSVQFPVGVAVAPLGAASQNELVLTGTGLGQLVRNPFVQPAQRLAVAATATPKGRWSWQSVYPSTHQPLPWWGLYNAQIPTGGVFVGIDDSDGAIKTFRYQHLLEPWLSTLWNNLANRPVAQALLSQPLWHGWRVDVEHPVAYGTAQTTYAPTWRAHFGIVDGDWFAFAQHYRARVLAQAPPWLATGPLATRADFAPWWQQIGVIQSSTTADTIKQLATSAATPTDGNLILWHATSWQDNTAVQTNDMPANHSTKVQWGEQLKTAHALGARTALYYWPTVADILQDDVNPSGAFAQWLQQQEGGGAAVQNSAGTFLAADSAPLAAPTAFGTPPQLHAMMCPAAPAWRTHLQQAEIDALTAAMLAGGGVDALYLDVIGATPLICHATTHEHAPGDPTGHTAGYRTALQQLRDTASAVQPTLGLYTEGFAETLIDQLDGMLVENQPWWERIVPITTAVYHDYTQPIGRMLWGPSHTLDIMTAWQTQVLVRGGLPGFGNVINSNSTKDRAIRAHLLQLGRLRRSATAALLYGTMLAPPVLYDAGSAPAGTALQVTPIATVPNTPISTRAVPLYEPTTTCTADIPCSTTLPTVDSSAWRQPDGSITIVLGSLELADSGAPRNVALSLSALRALAPNVQTLTVLNSATPQTLSLDTTANIMITLPRQSIALLRME